MNVESRDGCPLLWTLGSARQELGVCTGKYKLMDVSLYPQGLDLPSQLRPPSPAGFPSVTLPRSLGVICHRPPHSQLAGFGLRHSGYGAGVARSCPNSKWKTNIGKY